MWVGREAARLALGKKAEDAVLLDMREAVTYTDCFLVVHGRNPRQTKAIAEEIRRGLRAQGVRPARVEGERDGDWILLDYLDAVVHVFTPAAREFYRLETLWGDVPRNMITDESVGDAGVVADQPAAAGG